MTKKRHRKSHLDSSVLFLDSSVVHRDDLLHNDLYLYVLHVLVYVCFPQYEIFLKTRRNSISYSVYVIKNDELK